MKNKKHVPKIRFKGFDKEWKENYLHEVINLKSGKDYKHLSEGNIPVYGTGGFMLNVNEALSYNCNGIGIGRKGTIDKPYILYAPFWTVDTLFYALPKDNNDLDFIFDIFQKIDWRSKDESTGVPSLSKVAINSTKICTTEFIEQQAIGNYFQNIDRLVNTSQMKLDKLKNIKKACLEKMFPRNGSTTPELRFKGFSEEWKEKTMAKIGNTFNGLSGKTKDDFGRGDAKFITYMNVFSNPVADLCRTESVEIDNKQNSVQYGDILFTVSSETPEEVGMSSVWLGHEDNIYLNSFCFGYRLTTSKDPYYMAYLLRSKSIRKKIAFLAQGISRYNISKNRVMEIVLPFPDTKEQKLIGSFFKNIDDLINQTEQQINKLKNIKRACLDKMFVNTEDKI